MEIANSGSLDTTETLSSCRHQLVFVVTVTRCVKILFDAFAIASHRLIYFQRERQNHGDILQRHPTKKQVLSIPLIRK